MNDLDIMFSDDMNEETEYMPIIPVNIDDYEVPEDTDVPEVLPILTLRNSVLFPGVVIPITLAREKSLTLVKEMYRKKRQIGVITQPDPEVEDPTENDLFRVGTIANIVKTLKMPDGNSTVIIIQGVSRFALKKVVQTEPYITAEIQLMPQLKIPKAKKKFEALMMCVKDAAIQVMSEHDMPRELSFSLKNIDNPRFLLNFVASNVNTDVAHRQDMLEIDNAEELGSVLLDMLAEQMQMNNLKHQIQSKVRTDMDKQQREYMLNQQLRTIQEELGGTPNEQDVKELREKAGKKSWPNEVGEVFERELKKLERINPQSSDYSVQHNYLEYLVDLPWNEFTADNFDLKHAKSVLDADHYGLDKVKDRIIEHLAVLKLRADMKSPILCLVGPPGVGKTSLGKSIADALGRKYVRMSLGGLRDEAELRGHRKTYIGAMPGRILQNLRKVKSGNPVFVLDEIDKVSGNNVNGDPQAALLEILDPEQNFAFYDNFLELDYDLSNILFIATANDLSTVHPALRDRMEIIDLSGYLREEKYEIAKRHLIPKQLHEHGLSNKQITFKKPVVMDIIDGYTHEAGVRNLERRIADVMRSRARQVVNGDEFKAEVKHADLEKVLGVPRHHDENEIEHAMPGVATGLAWTSVGGEMLSIEVSLSRGAGHLSLTGNLGDVMKESATIAYEYIKSHAALFEIEPEVFDEWHVHVHIPEGATPKEGPSAGITILAAMTSAFTQRKVKSKMAMTGEITLRGRVLPVGGIKEKILAAKRNGITDIILSADNKPEFVDIKEDYTKGLKFHFVGDMQEVVALALDKKQDVNDLDYNKFLTKQHQEVIGFKQRKG